MGASAEIDECQRHRECHRAESDEANPENGSSGRREIQSGEPDEVEDGSRDDQAVRVAQARAQRRGGQRGNQTHAAERCDRGTGEGLTDARIGEDRR